MKKTLPFVLVFSLLIGPTSWANRIGQISDQKLLRISPHDEVKRSVIIRFRSEKAMNQSIADRRIPGAIQKRFRRFPLVTAELSGREATALAGELEVLSIEPDSMLYLHDWPAHGRLPDKLQKGRFYHVDAGPNDSWGVIPTHEYEPYGLAMLGVTKEFHAKGYLGQGVKVGIIDTGIDTGHPDLHVAGGWRFINGDDNAYGDVLGHGTHVAGIIAARRNGLGVVGVAPEADLYSLRAFDILGHAALSAILDCIQWAIEQKLDVLNMSFGMDQYSPALKEALEHAYEAGIVLVASAGNSGRGTDTVSYPARYDTVIAVSAIDRTEEIAIFSSRGPTVEVAAPGVDVLSTFTFPPHYEHFYDLLSGTSMAAPHVVGMAALILSTNPGITNEEVRRRLITFARDLGTPERDKDYGWGIPQPDRDPSWVNAFYPEVVAGGPYRGVVGEPVRFSVEGTLDMDNNLLTYLWDFGDGSKGEGLYPEHTYAEPGEYVATLTVLDDTGDVISESQIAEANVLVGAGIDTLIAMGATGTGYVKEPSLLYLGKNPLAGNSSRKRHYGLMKFDTPPGDDILLLSAELVLTCATKSPKDEGTITVGLLPVDIAERWPAINYPDIDRAAVRSLQPSIVMSYLPGDVGEGMEHRFWVPRSAMSAVEEQFKRGRLAFRIQLDTSLSSNIVTWKNPRLIVRYIDRISSNNMAPVAVAGYDRRVLAGSLVTLDGSDSSDLENRPLRYAWRQVGGPAVPLKVSSDNPAIATFIAPAGDSVLAFELTVNDGIFESSDQLKIYLNDAPSEIHTMVLTPGYGKAGYVADEYPMLNFFDKRVILSGVVSRWKTRETTTVHGQSIHVGAFQFDLNQIPRGSQIISATLELTGARRSPDRRTSYQVKVLAPYVDHQWSDLNYNTVTGAEAIATLSPTLTASRLDENKVNQLSVNPGLLEARRGVTDKVTFRVDGPTYLYGTIWEWYIWWSGNEEATSDRAPRLIVRYGAIRPEVASPPTPSPSPDNLPPVIELLSGVTEGEPGVLYPFHFSVSDGDRDAVTLTIDWGDGTQADVYPLSGGGPVETSHVWMSTGMYAVIATATDERGTSATYQFQVTIRSSVGQVLIISDTPTGTWYLGSSYGRRRQLQTFRAIGSKISAVSLVLVRVGAPTEPIRVSIKQALTAAPLGSVEVAPSQVTSTDSNNPSWVTVYFPASVEVNEGQGYYLVLEVIRADSAHYYRVGYESGNPYPYGMWYPDSTAREDLDMACIITFGE